MNKALVPLIAVGSAAYASSTIEYKDMSDDLKEGLVSSYSFENAGTPDFKVDNYDLTVWGQSPQQGAFTLIEEGGAAILKSGQQDPYKLNFASGLFGTARESHSFTLSFDLVDVSNSAAWATIVTLYSGAENSGSAGWNNAMSLLNDSGTLVIHTRDGGVTGYDGTGTNTTISTGIGTNAGKVGQVLTLVSDAENSSLTLYIDGEQKGTVANWNAMALTGISFDGTLGGYNAYGQAIIDNLNMWNRALSATEVASLIVPEPATATLSLLALAGLAARRRRH